jgi:hypothetical protein
MWRYKLATLQALQARGSVAIHDAAVRGNVATRSDATRLAGDTKPMACRADKYAILQQWRVALSKFLFFLVGSFNSLLYTRERKRKREQKRERKKEF